MSELRVVLDTNTLLVSIARKSKYRPIFTSLLEGHFQAIITNEILSEYVEIIERKANAIVAHNIAESIANLPNVEKIEISYKWNLITTDPDDNKFVDCAIAGRVKYVVTDDKHFNVLKDIPFPNVDVISIDEFLEEIQKWKEDNKVQ